MTDRSDLTQQIRQVVMEHSVCECQVAGPVDRAEHIVQHVMSVLGGGDYQGRDGSWHQFTVERWRGG